MAHRAGRLTDCRAVDARVSRRDAGARRAAGRRRRAAPAASGTPAPPASAHQPPATRTSAGPWHGTGTRSRTGPAGTPSSRRPARSAASRARTRREALDAWRAAQGRGVVVLPTGAGKTHVACMAIDDRRRSTLVVAPTLDLVRQWYDLLRATFGVPVGLIGGGEYDVRAAHRHDVRLGLPAHGAPGRAVRARRVRRVPSPARPGVRAGGARRAGPVSPRADRHARARRRPRRRADRAVRADRLPQGHRRALGRLPGAVRDRPPDVELGAQDRPAYEEARGIYRDFLARHGIRMSTPSGGPTS